MWQINDHLIPIAPGHAVRRGWANRPGPSAVVWHATAGSTLPSCRATIGGSNPSRKGRASAHYAVGRSFDEGVDQYVALEDRALHAGTCSLEADGSAAWESANEYAIGVEIVHPGFHWKPTVAPDDADVLQIADVDGDTLYYWAGWPEEQMEMAATIGRRIVERWPSIGPDDHVGHMDVAPVRKTDPSNAFPWATLLRQVYRDPNIRDVWTPYCTNRERQLALQWQGQYSGEIDGIWGPLSRDALRGWQRANGLAVDGNWTVFVSRAMARLESLAEPAETTHEDQILP